ncbi:hypothetical protein ACVWXN_005437 [Bradyrhizobium sp. i1.4.4]
MYFSREKSTVLARGCRTTNCIAAGNHEQLCDARLLEEIQNLGWIELARDHAAGAVIESHHAPAGAADVENRHRHQRHVVGGPPIPFRLVLGIAGLHEVEEVRMRQHRAFRLACRARRVELDRDVLRVDRHLRVVAALRIAPGCKILPFRRAAFGGDDSAHAGQLVLDLADLGDELWPHKQNRRLAIGDNEGDLGPGEAPVHRRHHHAGLHRAHQQLEIEITVLAEIGDAVAASDAHRDQCVGDLVGLDVELGKAGDAALELVGGGIAAAGRALAHHVGEIRQWLCGGHVSPVASCFCVAECGVIRGQRQYGRERATPAWPGPSRSAP